MKTLLDNIGNMSRLQFSKLTADDLNAHTHLVAFRVPIASPHWSQKKQLFNYIINNLPIIKKFI